MRKYLALLLSVITILLSFYAIYDTTRPKVGPIGEMTSIPTNFWIQTIMLIIAGICFLTLSVITIYKERK